MRNVLVINRALKYGGVEKIIFEVANNLQNKANFFVTYKNKKSVDAKIEEAFINVGVKLINLNESDNEGLLFSLFKPLHTLKIMRRTIKKYKIDVIHTCIDTYSGFYLKIAKRCGVKIRIAHSHTTLNMDIFRRHFSISKAVTLYEKRMINRYSTIRIACSTKSGLSFFGSRDNFDLLLNPLLGIDISSLNTFRRFEDDRCINLVQIGRMNDNKNFLFSLNVLNGIKNLGRKVKLLIVSNYTVKEYFDSLLQKARSLSLMDNIVFLKPDYDKNLLFSKATCLLLPSKNEGFGMTALESQAFSVPVFASENVPREVDYGLCLFLPLIEAVWVEEIINVHDKKLKLDKKIFNNTIDIYAAKLLSYYYK